MGLQQRNPISESLILLCTFLRMEENKKHGIPSPPQHTIYWGVCSGFFGLFVLCFRLFCCLRDKCEHGKSTKDKQEWEDVSLGSELKQTPQWFRLLKSEGLCVCRAPVPAEQPPLTSCWMFVSECFHKCGRHHLVFSFGTVRTGLGATFQPKATPSC